MTPSLRIVSLGFLACVCAWACAFEARAAESEGDAKKAVSRSESEGKAAAKAEVQKAQLQYKLGRFEEALTSYSRAYELFHAPALLFNIGQCHKNLKHHERAIFFFEGYLREETKVDARKRTLAEELIAESRADLERRRVAEAAEIEARRSREAAAIATATTPTFGVGAKNTNAGAGASSSASAVFGTPPPVPSSGPTLIDSGPQSPPAAKPLTRKWWFWTAVGAGALAVAGGVFALYSAGGNSELPDNSVGTLDRR